MDEVSDMDGEIRLFEFILRGHGNRGVDRHDERPGTAEFPRREDLMTMKREKDCKSGAWLKYLTLATLILGTSAAVIGMDTDQLLAVLNSQWVPSGFLGFLLLFGTLYNLVTVILGTLCYREKPMLSDEQLPSCTVIVPAYNEGKAVTIALDSILASNYPPEKLEIIAIDDGSRDDTWSWIARAAAASNGRIRGVKLEQNRGKRHAIQYGTKLSTKDVIITVDSDSVVEPDSIRRLNSPFIDPAVGAVAGSVKVSNLSDGVLPRMMDAHYAFSCCVLRAANSVLRTVVCTPGALSAYRRSALLEFLDAWANQTFCGRPAGIGEDRALTTFMLRNRWHVLYQRGAVVHTEMPSKYQATYRMMLRWERGNIREMLSTYEFAFRRFDWFHLAIQLNLIFQTYIFIQSLLFVPFVAAAMVAAPVFWFQSTFLLTILWTALPALCYFLMSGGTGWIWTFTYTFFRTFFLFWISPYSLLTVRNSGWLTRGKAEEAKKAARERFQQLSAPAAIFGKEVAGQQAPAAHVYFK